MKRAVLTTEPSFTDAGGGESPRTVSEAIYRRFREDILWGRLLPGTPLKSDVLRSTYKVGISPLREALSRLVSERLVTVEGQRGFRVATFTVDDVSDTMETRLVIESEALTRSIESGGLEWESAIISSHHLLSGLDLPAGPDEHATRWARQHKAFHMAVIAGCKSSLLMQIASDQFDKADRHRAIAVSGHPFSSRDPATEHRQIMDAALARNTKAAIAALGYHYRTTADLVIKQISGTDRN